MKTRKQFNKKHLRIEANEKVNSMNNMERAVAVKGSG